MISDVEGRPAGDCGRLVVFTSCVEARVWLRPKENRTVIEKLKNRILMDSRRVFAGVQ